MRPLIFRSFLFATACLTSSLQAYGEVDSLAMLYEQKQWTKAEHLLLKAPHPDDPAYYYNLGVIKYRQGHYGQAFAFFEKARALDPNDSQIRKNRAITQKILEKTDVRFLESYKRSARSPFEEVVASISINFILFSSSLALCVFSLVLFFRFRRLRQFWPAFRHLAPISLIGFLLVSGGVFAWKRLQPLDFFAVTFAETAVRSGPGEAFSEISRLGAGYRVRVLHQTTDADWLRIELNAGGSGWVSSSRLLLL